VPDELDGAIGSTGFCVLRPNTNVVVPEYLFYRALTDEFVLSVCSNQRGSSYPAVANTDVTGQLILVPPLAEQRRIAAVLNAILEAIAAQEDVIAALRQFKRSLMQRLFTYGPGREPAETKETRFGDLPVSWRIEPLGDCAVVQTGIAKGRRFGAHDKTREVPYLRVANVQNGYLDLREIKTIEIRVNEYERFRLYKGDVLMTEGGDFDKLGRGHIWGAQLEECVHQNHVFAVRVDQRKVSPGFLAYLSQCDYGRAYFLNVAHRTTNLASINSTKLKALPVPLPNLEEQHSIEESLSAADERIAAEEDRLTALQSLFKSTLHQLMTGHVRLPPDTQC